MVSIGELSRGRQILVVGVALLLIAMLYVNAPRLGIESLTGPGVEDANTVTVEGADWNPGFPYILKTDETWASGKTYVLNSDVIVPPQFQLTIEEGVEVLAKGGGSFAANFGPDQGTPDNLGAFWAMDVGIYVYGSLLVKGSYDEGQVRFSNQNQLLSESEDFYAEGPWYERLWNGIQILPAENYAPIAAEWGAIQGQYGGPHDEPIPEMPLAPQPYWDRLVHIDYAEIKDANVGIGVCGRSQLQSRPTVIISNSHIHDNYMGIMVGVGLLPRSMHNLDDDQFIDFHPLEYGPVGDLDGDGWDNNLEIWDFGDGRGDVDTSYDEEVIDPLTGFAVRGDGVRDQAWDISCGIYDGPVRDAPGPAAPLIELNYIENNYDFELAPLVFEFKTPVGTGPEDEDGDGWPNEPPTQTPPPPGSPPSEGAPPYEYGLIGEQPPEPPPGDGPIVPNGGCGIVVLDSSPMIRYNNISRNEDFGIMDIRFTENFLTWLPFAPLPENHKAGMTNTVVYHNNLIGNGYEAWWNLPIYEPQLGWLTTTDLQAEENFVKGNAVTWFGSDPITGTANKIEDNREIYLASQVAGGVTPRINLKLGNPWADVGPQGKPLALQKTVTTVQGSNEVDFRYNIYDEDDSRINEVKVFYRDTDDAPAVETGAVDVADMWGSPSTREGKEFYDIIGSNRPDEYTELSPENDDIYHAEWDNSPAIGDHAAYTNDFDAITLDGIIDPTEAWMDLTYKEQESGFYGGDVEDSFFLFIGNDVANEQVYIAGVFCSVEPPTQVLGTAEVLSLFMDSDDDLAFDESITLDDTSIGGSYITALAPGDFIAGAGPFEKCQDDSTDKRMFELKAPYSLDDQVIYDEDQGHFNLKFLYEQTGVDSVGTSPPSEFVFPTENVHHYLYDTVDIPNYMTVQMERYYTGWHVLDLDEVEPNVWEGTADIGNPVDLDDMEWYTYLHGPHRDTWFDCHPVNDYGWHFTLWDGTDSQPEKDPLSGTTAATDSPADNIADLDDFVVSDGGLEPTNVVVIPGGETLIMMNINVHTDNDGNKLEFANYGTIVAGPGVSFTGSPNFVNFGTMDFNGVNVDGGTAPVEQTSFIFAVAGNPLTLPDTGDDSPGPNYKGANLENIETLGIAIPTNNHVTTSFTNGTINRMASGFDLLEDPRCDRPFGPITPDCSNVFEIHNNELTAVEMGMVILGAEGNATNNVFQDGSVGVEVHVVPELQSPGDVNILNNGFYGMDDVPTAVTPDFIGLEYAGGPAISGVGLLINIREGIGDLDNMEEITTTFPAIFDMGGNTAQECEKEGIYLTITSVREDADIPPDGDDYTTNERIEMVIEAVNFALGWSGPSASPDAARLWELTNNNQPPPESASGEDYDGHQVHDVTVDAGILPPPDGPVIQDDDGLFCPDLECPITVLQPGGGTEDTIPVLNDLFAFDKVIKPNATGWVSMLASDEDGDVLTFDFTVGIKSLNATACGTIVQTLPTNAFALYSSPVELPEGVDEIECYINGSVQDDTNTITGSIVITVREETVNVTVIIMEPEGEDDVVEDVVDLDYNTLILDDWVMLVIIAFFAWMLVLYFMGSEYFGVSEDIYEINNKTFILYFGLVIVFWVISIFWSLRLDLGFYLSGDFVN